MAKPGPKPGTPPSPARRAANNRLAAMLKARYGADFYRRIGAIGGSCEWMQRADPERYYTIKERAGTIGGMRTLELYGIEQYAAWGRKSAEMRKEQQA